MRRRWRFLLLILLLLLLAQILHPTCVAPHASQVRPCSGSVLLLHGRLSILLLLFLLGPGPWDGAGIVGRVMFALLATLRNKLSSLVSRRIIENGVHLVLQHRDIGRLRDV